MTRMRMLVCSIWMIAGAARTAAADVPTSLRMRGRPVGSAPVRRVAQAAPDPAPAPASDAPPAPASDAPPAPARDAAPAPASDAPPPADSAPPPTVAQSPALTDDEIAKLAEQEAKNELIIVTGSTIERKTLTTTAPLTILSRKDIEGAGRTTLGDILQQIPAQTGGTNAQINNGGDGSSRIDLRGIGPDRTLVLLNGRRMVASGGGADASVDINTIPLAMIERVEVLKDGASAVYGSDAIGGVVNIITRNDFEGSEVTLFTGTSQRGDGTSYDASFVTGHNFDNHKGNIVFSAGFERQEPIFAGDRRFSEFDNDFNYDSHKQVVGGSPASNGGHIDASSVDLDGDGKADGVNLCGAGVQFCTNDGKGGFRAYDTLRDQYNYQPVNYLATPSQRYNVFTAGNYRLLPHVSAFYEASYIDRTSSQQLAPEPIDAQFLDPAIAISKNSIYNPTGGDVLNYDRRLSEFGPRLQSENVETFRFVGGFQGALASDAPVLPDWKWEVSYNYGRTNATQINTGDLILSHLALALGPSYRDATGAPTCGVQGGPQIKGCVPLNLLGPAGSIDPAARDYLSYTGVSSGFDEQQSVLASAHGRLVKLPNHGDISASVGADYRRESGASTPDPLTATGDTTGLQIAPTAGSYNVVEGFGELSVVPYTGDGALQWVELNAAARGFRYDSFGSGVTWKVGGLIKTVEGIALRGTYSTAFRAPSIGELFSGQSTSFPSVEDPCDTKPPSAGGATRPLDAKTAAECKNELVPANAVYGTSQQRTLVGGNPDLDPEKAKVLTAGVVLEPPQVPGLSLTVDYWNIDIQDTITGLSVTTVLNNCYQAGEQAFCHQIHRNPQLNYAITQIDSTELNAGETKTSGIDGSIAFDRDIGPLGRLHSRVDGTYLLRYNLDDSSHVIHGRGNFDLNTSPTLKANLSASLDHPSGLGGGFNVRYIGSFEECKLENCTDGLPSHNVPAYYKTDLFASYSVKSTAGRTTITLGVNNLTDATPALLFGGANDSDGTAYDFIGRFFYARLSQRF